MGEYADWPGVDERKSLVGTGYSVMVNTSHRDRGVLRRRPGFSGRVGSIGTSVVTSNITFNDSIVYQNTTAIKAVDVTTNVVTDLSAALTTTTPGNFAKVNGRVYYSNGTDGPYVFDSATAAARSVGIAAPSGIIGSGTVTASIGKITAGPHLYRYRYYNSTTGYVSNPSGALSITHAANDSITFSVGASATDIIRSVTSGVDTIILEVTLQSGGSFFQATTVANTVASSVTFALSDASLSATLPVGLQYGDDGNLPMPAFNLISEHRGRIFGYQSSTQLLGWSRPAFPESWDITRYARKLSVLDASTVPTALVSYLGDLYIFTKYGCYRYIYVNDPSQGTVLPVPTVEGLWNQRCAVLVDGQLFGLGANGAWIINGISPVHISTEIDPFIQRTFDPDQATLAFAFYSLDDYSVTWLWRPLSGTVASSVLMVGVTYQLRTKTWETREYSHTVSAAAQVALQTYYFTSLSTTPYLWAESLTAFDGVATDITITVGVGSTTTNIVTVESMSDYVGSNLVINGVSRQITGYGANSLTVVAFPSAPTNGDVGTVGGINVRVTPGWNMFNYLTDLVSPVYLAMAFEPAQDDIYHRMSIALNFGGVQVFTQGPGDTPPDGLRISNGATYVDVAADGGSGLGFVSIPVQTEYLRSLQWYFDSWAPAVPFGLLEIRAMSRPEAATKPGIGE